ERGVDSGAAANHNRSRLGVARMQRRGPAGRCLVLVLLTLVAPTVAAVQRRSLPVPVPPTAMRGQLGHDPARLRTWLAAASRHLPGQADAAAVLVGSWTIPQLETIYFDFTALIQ